MTQTAPHTDRREPSPVELILELQRVFPDFRVATEGHDEMYNPISLHTVMMDFAYWIGISLPTATQKQVEDLGGWLDSAVESGGNLENAVSTCLLEHAFRLNIEKRLRPHINAATKRAMHP